MSFSWKRFLLTIFLGVIGISVFLNILTLYAFLLPFFVAVIWELFLLKERTLLLLLKTAFYGIFVLFVSVFIWYGAASIIGPFHIDPFSNCGNCSCIGLRTTLETERGTTASRCWGVRIDYFE